MPRYKKNAKFSRVKHAIFLKHKQPIVYQVSPSPFKKIIKLSLTPGKRTPRSKELSCYHQ